MQKCEFNMDNLSKPELLTLLSIMEGELEARDLVIEALRVHWGNIPTDRESRWSRSVFMPTSGQASTGGHVIRYMMTQRAYGAAVSTVLVHA
ncbi:Cortactin-binding protein 2 [Nibea albiflora]|uniref:Cortactin-binding protein 2 n=1 Tax=Nibea albiflora TaxID=240163 RepID=A0ACB7FDL7_NIBAL|nr:Cortactin-binding protein 2 [Nibea albiflora]